MSFPGREHTHTHTGWKKIAPTQETWEYNTLLQTTVSPNLRTAWLDSHSPCPRSCLCCGTLCCPGLLWWSRRPTSRNIDSSWKTGSFSFCVSHQHGPRPPARLHKSEMPQTNFIHPYWLNISFIHKIHSRCFRSNWFGGKCARSTPLKSSQN